MEFARYDIIKGFLIGPRTRASQDRSVFVFDFHHKVDRVLATSVKRKLANHRANALKKLGSIFHPLPSTKENSCSVFTLLRWREQRTFATSQHKHCAAFQRQRLFSLRLCKNQILPRTTNKARFVCFLTLGSQLAPIDISPINIRTPGSLE